MSLISTLAEYHQRYLDGLIQDPEKLSIQEQRRARLLVGSLSYIAIFTAIMWLVRFNLSGFNLQTQLTAFTPIFATLLLIFYRKTGRINGCADALVVFAILTGGVIAYHDGGLYSQVLFWFSAIPIFSQFLAYRFQAFATCLCLGGIFVGLYFAHVNNLIPTFGDKVYLFGRLMAGLATLIFVGVVAKIYDNTRYLSSAELIKEKAEAADQHKSDFLANMSHELRTPFNAVLNMLELLLNSSLTQEQRHRATLAHTSAESLLVVIDDILDFSKVEAGKQELEYIDFDLRELLGSISGALAFQADVKGLELILDDHRVGTGWVHGDPTRLRQIISNLMSNAIKFTKNGQVILWAELIDKTEVTEGSDEEKCESLSLNIKIVDSGIGIPNDKIDGLFQSFTQVDSSTSRQFGGTGLGLAIVKKLCELMGGTVSVSSELGKGSIFSFNVELKKANSAEFIPENINLSGKRILLVDDNSHTLAALSAQLKSWGASVVSAQSAKRALLEIEKNYGDAFDLAFIDMLMPSMNGKELLKKIHALELKKPPTFIMMTPIESIGHEDTFSNLDVAICFPKPATYADLSHAITFLDPRLALKAKNNLTEPHHGTHQKENLIEYVHYDGEPICLLVVDDNAINLEVADAILHDLGYQTVMAGSGQEALDKLNNMTEGQNIHGILMDCQMPIMDGFQTTKAIRQGEGGIENSQLPIIALTANAMKGDEEICLAAGMDGYLSKPLNVKKLSQVIHSLIKVT